MIVWFAEDAARGERWQPTQADAKRVRNGGEIAQQTVAEGGREMMCNLLNNCERPETPQLEPVAAPVLPDGKDATFEPDEPSLRDHLGADDIMDDGHPRGRSAFTGAQVAASALPTSIKVQDVCQLISKMNAGELGFVALEVIARGASLGGIKN